MSDEPAIPISSDESLSASSPGEMTKTVPVPAPLASEGERIGRYKLLQLIGEGGCGVVYMAEQSEPVRRRVALKIIKLGMDTKAVIARFEAERQALALMDHTNIAKVLDAGATETGRPFFVMELVRGVRITDYCDEQKLSPRERLDLFNQVCNAIQHAHQKGIIHRDIKPSNILVTINDAVPVPKVIDFGIAKATTDQRLTDKTVFTAFEQFIGTPAYMSPEQAVMTSLDIDTRSDIYALGVLLYELLTGRTPFDTGELMKAGLDEMRRTIREEEPNRPSTRLSTMLEGDLAKIARHRRSEAPRLIHLLRGDLDWIVMKALEKDRTRRYETANALAMDIQRHLKNEPVVARPPSTLYRFQKLVRRNKTAFAAVGAVAVALVFGLSLSLYLFFEEKKARQRAVTAEQEQARLRKEAEVRAEMGQKMALAGLYLTQDRFDEAEQAIGGLPPHPASAGLFHALGRVHGHRGNWEAAAKNLRNVVQVLPDDPVAYHFLAPLLVELGDREGYAALREGILKHFTKTSDPVIAERMAKDCLILPPPPAQWPLIKTLVNTAVAAGPEHKLWPYFQFVKALAEYRAGNHQTAAEWLHEVVTPQGYPYRRVQAHMVLAMSQYKLGRTDEARATLAQGLEIANTRLPRIDKGNLGPDWNDWLIVHALIREAKALIQ